MFPIPEAITNVDEALKTEQETLKMLEEALGIHAEKPIAEAVTGDTLLEQLQSSKDVLHDNLAKISADIVQVEAGPKLTDVTATDSLAQGCVQCVRENHKWCFIKSSKHTQSVLPSTLASLLSIPVTSGSGTCCHTSSKSPACDPITFQSFAGMAEF